MKTKQEYNSIVAEILRDLRKHDGSSAAKMAGRMAIDERTYRRYEAGDSSPSLAEFLSMLDQIDAPALPTIMRHLYPESFTQGEKTEAAQRRLLDHLARDASGREIEQLNYIVNGAHGSPIEAQLQMFTALDHLSIEVRLAIAKLTINAWEIEESRGGIINPGEAMPDIELLRQAIIKAQAAIIAGRKSYTSAIK